MGKGCVKGRLGGEGTLGGRPGERKAGWVPQLEQERMSGQVKEAVGHAGQEKCGGRASKGCEGRRTSTCRRLLRKFSPASRYHIFLSGTACMRRLLKASRSWLRIFQEGKRSGTPRSSSAGQRPRFRTDQRGNWCKRQFRWSGLVPSRTFRRGTVRGTRN